MKVLIADDSSVSRRLLQATLLRWDYEVQVVCDGAEAWEALQHDSDLTLAILDWMMPALTGPDVCRLVRQQAREPYTYLILLTSKGLKEDLIEGMEAGADDYLVKPFDQHELKVRLRAARRILDLQAELVRAREALRVQATHDALTGIWNRRAILDALGSELSRAIRGSSPLGVSLCDLDHFKRVNDSHGHATGDVVLQEAVRRMESEMRAYDSIGRYGGEEFLIVLPNCDEQRACGQVERLRAAVSREPIPYESGAVTVTASFGVTAWMPGATATPESLIHAADDALYQAKDTGRNRVYAVGCGQALTSHGWEDAGD